MPVGRSFSMWVLTLGGFIRMQISVLESGTHVYVEMLPKASKTKCTASTMCVFGGHDTELP